MENKEILNRLIDDLELLRLTAKDIREPTTRKAILLKITALESVVIHFLSIEVDK